MGEIKTGIVGRSLWGHPSKGSPKTDDDNRPVLKDGVQVIQWSVGLAFNKAEFQAAIWPEMSNTAGTMFGNNLPADFAWKYKDGDTGLDKNNKPLRDKEGYAGCYILAISTEAFAPPVFKWNSQRGAYDQVPVDGIKTGDFFSPTLNIVAHRGEGRRKSGLYINPVAFELVAYGTPIVSASAPDPMELFGGRQHQLPPGASLTPISGAPQGVGMPMGGAAQPGQMPMGGQQPVQQYAPQQMQPAPQGYQQPVYSQPQQPVAQPAYDYVAQTTGQPYPAQPGQMPMGGQQPVQQYAPQQMQPAPQGYQQQQIPNGGMQPQPQPGMMPQGGLPGMPR